MHNQNKFSLAFKEQLNLISMAVVSAVSIAMVDPTPFFMGLVAEAAYVLFVPDTAWFRNRIARREEAQKTAARNASRNAAIPLLRADTRARFDRLCRLRDDISAHPVEGESWFAELLAKLDYLLDKFLLFAKNEVQFRGYLESLAGEISIGSKTPENRKNVKIVTGESDSRYRYRDSDILNPAPNQANSRSTSDIVEQIQAHYDSEIATVRTESEAEQDTDTLAVLNKRIDVLTRRQEFVVKIGKITTNLSHQTQLLEDSFGLINDQIRARSPEQILMDVDEVVVQTDTMTQAIEELAPYEHMVQRMST